jgi:hypothetical protein
MKQLFLKKINLTEGLNDISLDEEQLKVKALFDKEENTTVRCIQIVYNADSISMYFKVDRPHAQDLTGGPKKPNIESHSAVLTDDDLDE